MAGIGARDGVAIHTAPLLRNCGRRWESRVRADLVCQRLVRTRRQSGSLAQIQSRQRKVLSRRRQFWRSREG